MEVMEVTEVVVVILVALLDLKRARQQQTLVEAVPASGVPFI